MHEHAEHQPEQNPSNPESLMQDRIYKADELIAGGQLPIPVSVETPEADDATDSRESLITPEQQRLLQGLRMDPSMPADARSERSGNGISVRFENATYEGQVDGQGRLVSLRVGDRTLRFTQPIDASNVVQVAWNVVRALRHAERGAQREGLTIGTTLNVIGGVRMHFSSEFDGARREYVAVPEGLFRVTDEPPMSQEQRQEYEKVHKEYRSIIDHYSSQYDIAPFMIEAVEWEPYLRRFPQAQQQAARETLLGDLARVELMRVRIHQFGRRANARVVMDVASGERRFAEYTDQRPNNFSLRSFDAASNIVASTGYMGGAVTERQWSEGESSTRLTRDDAAGSITASVLDARGTVQYARVTRADGTVERVRRDDTVDRYGPTGEFEYRTVVNRIFFRDAEGTLFAGDLPTAEFRRHVTTAQQYFLWERVMRFMSSPLPSDPERRLYGLELSGLTKRVAALQEQYQLPPIHLDRAPSGTAYSLSSVEQLSQRFVLIEQVLRTYPVGFLRRLDIRSIYFVGGTRNDLGTEDSIGSVHRAAAHSDSLSRVLALSLDNTPERIPLSMHHEISHFSAFAVYGSSAPPARWWWRGTGQPPAAGSDDYSREYGMRSTHEDIATVAEMLHTSRESRALRDRARNQPVLAEKIRQIERMYYLTSNGRMDAQYWQDVQSGVTINAQYWERREKDGLRRVEEWERDRENTQFVLGFEPRITAARQGRGVEAARELARLCVELIERVPQQNLNYYRELDGALARSDLSVAEKAALCRRAVIAQPQRAAGWTVQDANRLSCEVGEFEAARQIVRLVYRGTDAAHMESMLKRIAEQEQKYQKSRP